MNFLQRFTALLTVAALSGCATVVKQGMQDVSVVSSPAGVEFVVRDASGNEIQRGRTPQPVKLATGAGYFKPAVYTIATTRGGKILNERKITGTVSGWYFGNILIGGIIGMIVVDPMSGAMYSLPDEVNLSTPAVAATTTHTLQIASADTLTPQQRAALVLL